MKIILEEDLTGFAPRSSRYTAYNADTYDGAEDSRNRSTVGYGPTPDAAIADLLELLAAEAWLTETDEEAA